jgi:hypothetical protein
MLQTVLATAGMLAVGYLVWRALQRREARDAERSAQKDKAGPADP